MARKRVKKNRKLTGKMQRKLVLLFALVLIALIVLNGHMIYINAASGDRYTKKVLSQKGYRSESIPFRRGAIKDINGEVLAISEKVYYVIFDCNVLNTVNEKKKETVQNETIRALTEHFSGLDEETLRGYLRDKPTSTYIRILKEVPYDVVQEFKEKQEENENIQGVWFEETYIRKYPGDYLASNLLGFTVSGDVGNWGVEEYYNDQLNGIAGRTYGYLNDESALETSTQAAVDGNNVILNIDAGIQRIVEKHVTAFNEEHRNEAKQGLGSKHTAVIIQNVNTGAILAQCSYPYYNLNDPRDLTYIGLHTEEEVEAMSTEQLRESLSEMWRNFCISDTYEPGSTFKPFTAAMGLESGKLTGNESFYCDGYEIVDNTRVRCSHTAGHGQLDFEGAIANSCNDALMQMSYKIGVDTFTKYQRMFGFGKKTGIDLKGEVNAAGLLFTKDNMKGIDLAVNSFGQNFNVTMMQMMSGFCALVNGGYYYQPQVAARIENPDGDVLETFRPKLLKQIISSETSAMIRSELLAVVERGTAPSAKVPGYQVGGKTGTAEKFPRGQGTYLVSFIGCAPIDNPEIACYVVIDEPNVESQANSRLALILWQNIMAEVLPYYNLPSEDDAASAPVDIDWSVGGDEAWADGESFAGDDITAPDEDAPYYQTGDTASNYTGGENEPYVEDTDTGDSDTGSEDGGDGGGDSYDEGGYEDGGDGGGDSYDESGYDGGDGGGDSYDEGGGEDGGSEGDYGGEE